MDSKRRLFIYDRKEVGILILLGVGVALFAFTLGVHLGKQVVPERADSAMDSVAVEPIAAASDQPPVRSEIAQEVKNIPAAVNETLDQSLRDEIAKTGLQIDGGRQIDLPTEVRGGQAESPKTGAPTASSPTVSPSVQPVRSFKGKYTLQVGSFPSLRDAEPELLKLNENGLRAEVREVEIPGKGRWFRLFVGQFDSVKDAERAGKAFQKERRIADFVVARKLDP